MASAFLATAASTFRPMAAANRTGNERERRIAYARDGIGLRVGTCILSIASTHVIRWIGCFEEGSTPKHEGYVR